MNSSDQNKITKNLKALQKELKNDLNEITNKLYVQKVFTSEVRREIQEMRCRLPQLQCSVFINHLLRSGGDAFNKFKRILIDMGHSGVVKLMENSGHTERRICWAEDRGKTFVLPDLKVPERIIKHERIDEDHEKEMSTADKKLEDNQQLERLATFVLTKLDRDCETIDENDVDEFSTVDTRVDNATQLERLATFVLTKLDLKDRNNNKVNTDKEFKQKLEEETKRNKEFTTLLRALKNDRFPLTA